MEVLKVEILPVYHKVETAKVGLVERYGIKIRVRFSFVIKVMLCPCGLRTTLRPGEPELVLIRLCKFPRIFCVISSFLFHQGSHYLEANVKAQKACMRSIIPI